MHTYNSYDDDCPKGIPLLGVPTVAPKLLESARPFVVHELFENTEPRSIDHVILKLVAGSGLFGWKIQKTSAQVDCNVDILACRPQMLVLSVNAERIRAK